MILGILPLPLNEFGSGTIASCAGIGTETDESMRARSRSYVSAWSELAFAVPLLYAGCLPSNPTVSFCEVDARLELRTVGHASANFCP